MALTGPSDDDKDFQLRVELKDLDGGKDDYIWEAISVVHVGDPAREQPDTSPFVPPIQDPKLILDSGLLMETPIEPNCQFRIRSLREGSEKLYLANIGNSLQLSAKQAKDDSPLRFTYDPETRTLSCGGRIVQIKSGNFQEGTHLTFSGPGKSSGDHQFAFVNKRLVHLVSKLCISVAGEHTNKSYDGRTVVVWYRIE